jgi:hypothetical protein
LLVGILLAPSEASLSQPHYEEITLDGLVNRANAIVVARRAEPFVKTVTIRVPDARRGGKAIAGGKVREVTVGVQAHCFHVIEVLYARAHRWQPPWNLSTKATSLITVLDANAERMALHYRLHARGVLESPVLERYGPPGRGHVPAEEPSILFLGQPGRGEGLFALLVQGAFEPLSARPKVEEALRKLAEMRRANGLAEPPAVRGLTAPWANQGAGDPAGAAGPDAALGSTAPSDKPAPPSTRDR